MTKTQEKQLDNRLAGFIPLSSHPLQLSAPVSVYHSPPNNVIICRHPASPRP